MQMALLRSGSLAPFVDAVPMGGLRSVAPITAQLGNAWKERAQGGFRPGLNNYIRRCKGCLEPRASNLPRCLLNAMRHVLSGTLRWEGPRPFGLSSSPGARNRNAGFRACDVGWSGPCVARVVCVPCALVGSACCALLSFRVSCAQCTAMP